MKFYRRLQPVSALSFDLDDTLYANRPIMVNTEQQMLSYFSENFPQTAEQGQQQGQHFWRQFRWQALAQQPQLSHDVSALRLYSYTLAFTALGYSVSQAKVHAQAAFEHFLAHRSNFSLPPKSKRLLAKLAEHFPLVAITNGNVNFEKLGLSALFQQIYYPGQGVKRKPASDMFHKACQQLTIRPAQLLHIGDCGKSDVLGALQAGCQVAWLNKYDVGKPISVLPHFELSNLDDLLFLL
jgi:FMN hydrolase / 5-amino-6-(5-phospho-D-ribitylamino)uracil phosphatase